MSDGTLESLNDELRQLGLCEIALVEPDLCLPQDINARYMDAATMQNLIDNVQRDGRLESVPLVVRHPKREGFYSIISGHHRIEAAKKAQLAKILVMITEVPDEDSLRAKQLSHNAISGQDDEQILARLWEGIKSLEARYYAGLGDALDRVDFSALSFRAGVFKQFTVSFLPEDIDSFDKACAAVRNSSFASGMALRVSPIAEYEDFARAIREIKRVEDIKSNGTALSRLVELARERLSEIMEAAGESSDDD
jgi:hypothetical protein